MTRANDREEVDIPQSLQFGIIFSHPIFMTLISRLFRPLLSLCHDQRYILDRISVTGPQNPDSMGDERTRSR